MKRMRVWNQNAVAGEEESIFSFSSEIITRFLLVVLLMVTATSTTAAATFPLVLPKSFSLEDQAQIQQRLTTALACKGNYTRTSKNPRLPCFSPQHLLKRGKEDEQHNDYHYNNEGCSPITTLIHQTWKTKDIPAEFQAYHQSWIDQNPDWYVLVWTDDDAVEFIENNFPWFLETFRSYPYSIERADAIRPFVLYSLGGVYADTDYECKEPISSYIKTMAAPVGLITPKSKGFSNSLMIAAPNHNFFRYLIHELQPALEENSGSLLKHSHVVHSTGPRFIDQRADSYSHPEDLCALTSALFSPCSFCDDESNCKCSGCWAWHHYAKSWNDWTTTSGNFFRCGISKNGPLLIVLCGVVCWALAFKWMKRRRAQRNNMRYSPLLVPRLNRTISQFESSLYAL